MSSRSTDATRATDDTEERRPTGISVLNYFVWAFVAGATIPLATANNAILNTRSAHVNSQAFYTALLGVVLGGISVLPLVLPVPKELSLPTTWWSWLGGLCTLPSFGMLLAVPVLGVQVTLLIVLCGQLFATLLIDSLDGRALFSGFVRIIALGSVVVGCCLDGLQFGVPQPQSLSVSAGAQTPMIVLVALSAAVGIGYSCQAKCNTVLAKGLGSPARATLVSALVNLGASIPIICILCVGFGRSPVFLVEDWWRLVAAALQSAFYIYTMSTLPSKVGYTACFLAIHAGMLCVSAAVDNAGLAGQVRKISVRRCMAIALVLVGAYVFNQEGSHDLNSECVEPDESMEPLQVQRELKTA